jgi:predicted dehydrogenase
MIKLGIIGLGNVSLGVHLPILKSRSDIQIVWICDKSKIAQNICKKINIPFYDELDKALNFSNPEIVLITTPYNTRSDIFKKIKNKVKGVYCEKPFALSFKEHLDYVDGYEKYAFTIGYQRRSLGNVQILRNIVSNNLFGNIKEISIQFGDLHYSFGTFRANSNIAGGGILFESGSHWIDTALFFSNAVKIENFNSNVKYEDGLDVHGEGGFDIYNLNNEIINCNFKFSSIENTSNKIIIKFESCYIELYLYEDNSNLIIKTKDKKKFTLNDYNMNNYPNDSISQGASYWENFLKSYKEKKLSYSTNDTLLLTTKIIELYYAK